MLSGMCTRRHTLLGPVLLQLPPSILINQALVLHPKNSGTNLQLTVGVTWKARQSSISYTLFYVCNKHLENAKLLVHSQTLFFLQAPLKIKNQKVILDSYPPPSECNKKRTQIWSAKYKISCSSKTVAQKEKDTEESGVGRELRSNQEKPLKGTKQTSQILRGLGKSWQEERRENKLVMPMPNIPNNCNNNDKACWAFSIQQGLPKCLMS